MLERIRNAFQILSRDADVERALKEVQRALIASDVDVRLVADLVKEIKGAEIPKGVPKSRYVMKLLYDRLVDILGGHKRPFPVVPQRILLLGLYGSGKTTTAAKLGHWLQKRGLDVILVAADTHRPAAYDQLKQLAERANLKFFGIPGEKDPVRVVEEALKQKADVYIVDTAGRTTLDEDLVDEVKRIRDVLIPEKTLLVIPADMGQSAGREAERFAREVGIDGVIVTKMDGSGKGGGALSACAAAGVPVYFIGTGEHIKDFEEFDAAKFVSRLLGVPDIEKLAELAEETEINVEDILEGEYDINKFYAQIKATREMGPIDKVLEMLGIRSVPKELKKMTEEKFKKYDAIYKSMTKYERAHPEVLQDPSRIKRIARGSGTSEEDVHEFLRDYKRSEKLVKKLRKKGSRKQLERMLASGRLPIPK
ncbi:MAG: signal recognition particle subunit [Candidatus Diapherotrites archaeon]|nr:signal recognition particle subunit [Candidatus Diapherotrites archaeon]MDN5366888.1 signal recognition particle subunit [Candidatus Diapherotrites archaeon]